jgi:phosphatidylserine/phosphatidylglycerophosphate/cardiolipin synthase-like enzyme
MAHRRSGPVLAVLLALVAGLLVVLSAPTAQAVDQARKKPRPKPAPAPAAPVVPGQPPRNYVMGLGSVFSFPNRGQAEQRAIRTRVLFTVGSVWGAAKDPATKVPVAGGGTIRIATWSFDDWPMARALVAAKKRGVSVQLVAAAGKNKYSAPWRYVRKNLGARLYPAGRPDLAERSSFARICRGSCRGPGGTAHAKYFLFDNVGAAHARYVAVNTSMNLTTFAYENQWNHATTWHDPRVWSDFLTVFRQASAQVKGGFHAAWLGGGISDYFFPYPSMPVAQDPVVKWLAPVVCAGATRGASPYGYTRIRIIQYATYGDRGVYLAKRLRQLWNQGCDIKMIYSVASRPVLKILRARYGRGPVPMRQSVVTNSRNEILKYNHSKWMAITGHWGTETGKYVVLTGSANWADLATTSDEQVQAIQAVTWTVPFIAAFDKTWNQKSSRRAGGSAHLVGGRVFGPDPLLRHAPAGDPQFGTGLLRHLEED